MARWLSAIGLLLALGYIATLAFEKKPTPAQTAKSKAYTAELVARSQRGPYIDRTTKISATEELSELRIPATDFDGELALPSLDERCLIYRNREFGSAQMLCKSYSGTRE